MRSVRGGRASYGEAIGVLMLDTRFPRLPGDVGNATTFDFPVRYHVVRGATGERVVVEQDRGLLRAFVEGARELEAAGVRAITTSCGFLTMFQRELAAAVEVPVFTSSLLQVPIVHRMLKPDRQIGILTANDERLGPELLRAVGIGPEIPLVIAGAQHSEAFYGVIHGNRERMDTAAIERAVVDLAVDLVARHPAVGAFVCEGTNFAMFGAAVQEATGRPFFDIVTLTRWVHAAVVRRPVAGGFL